MPDARTGANDYADPAGAAFESAMGRTDLAWVRSTLAFGGVGAAMLKNLAPIGRARPVEGAIAIALGVAVALLAAAYMVRRKRAGTSTRTTLLLVSAGTVAVGVLAVVIGSTSP